MGNESQYAVLGAEDRQLVDDYIAAKLAQYRETRTGVNWEAPGIVQVARENWSAPENLVLLRVKNEHGQSAVLDASNAVSEVGQALFGPRETFDLRLRRAGLAVGALNKG